MLTSKVNAFHEKDIDRVFIMNRATFVSCSITYDYHFNGKESNNDWTGNSGDSYDFGARMYDGRLGRWLSPDQKEEVSPDNSTYSAFNCRPVYFNDPTGMSGEVTIDKDNSENAVLFYCS